jgi:hypothetical protein
MAIGPLESFVFPGVLVRTVNEAAGASAAGDIRFPAFIGVSAEEVRVADFEMVRGSSAIADNIILDELVTGISTTTPSGYTPGWIGGAQGSVKSFRVANFPIVIGDGSGKVATSPGSVIVTVNGENVAVNAINGLTGQVDLVVIPQDTDDVRCNYYFKRRDTYVENENLSDQATGSNVYFKVHNTRIVKGDNGGSSATDADITNVVKILYDPTAGSNPGDEFERTVRVIDVKVNGLSVAISELDGAHGIVTLAAAPAALADVRIYYFTNVWQDTYDILPAPVVNRIVNIGLSQDTSDYSIGTDCVLSGSNRLHWGNSYQVTQGLYTVGSTPVVNNVVASLADTLVYGRVATPSSPFLIGLVSDTDTDGNVLNDGTGLVFTLPSVPVTGSGTGTPTESPSDIIAYVGTTWATATVRQVQTITGNVIKLVGPAPSHTAPGVGEKVFVTYYENNIVDDSWTMTVRVPGATGVGKYTIGSTLHGNALQVTQSGGTVSPVYAGSGADNVEVSPLVASVERVTVTFDGVGGFAVTSATGPLFTPGTGRTGSVITNNQNKGYLGKTYVDPTTGFRVAFQKTPFAPTVGQYVTYDIGDPTASGVSSLYITNDTNIVKVLPGINLTISSSTGSYADDTATIDTYNKSGNEPNVGDIYYVTFDKAKTDYTTRFLTNMRDVIKYFGPVDINNKLSIAANLAFMNGARAVALKQIVRASGQPDASVQAYIDGIDSFNEPMPNGLRPSLIQPLSTDAQVQGYLKTSNAIQSSIRYRNERTSIIGFAVGTTSDQVIQRCKNIASEKVTALYPDGAIIGITDTFGNEVEYIVDGSMIAAAVAGRDASPVNDIATPLTNATVVGFKRLYRRLDNVTAALVANSGCTVLEEQTPVIRILMYLTTDMSTVLTRDPRIVEVKHSIQQGIRVALNRYIGAKNLPKMQPQIRDTVGSYFKQLKQNEIIVDFTGINVRQDDSDPSTVVVDAFYSPVFPLNWISVTLNLRQSL